MTCNHPIVKVGGNPDPYGEMLRSDPDDYSSGFRRYHGMDATCLVCDQHVKVHFEFMEVK